ncbi:MAG: MoxR family ATPase, partial [Anaerolineae bacterium]|nr:MoxR family ATPase [Anaerolineae bacterium]
AFMHLLRQENLFKLPGVAESLDWINALIALDQHELSLAVINDTLGVVLKNHEDSKMVHGDMAGEIFAQVISGD